MNFFPPEIDAYAEAFTRAEGEVLAALNRETWAKVLTPRMLSGHLQGQVLRMFSMMMRPKSVLEIGTYTGYSAICLAEGLAEDGKLITIDINEELHDMVLRYLEMAGLTGRVSAIVGNALEVIPTLQGTFDLVFIDADKENYATYFDLVIDRTASGGFIIADNVLWSGKVLLADSELDRETIALKDFARKLKDDPRVETVLLPIRDGLLVARKV
ncbi:MAG: O-methyltransferase [Flavobacteriales bacterium]|nr:O-methyltransferase [Flavobacteriales bacterium]